MYHLYFCISEKFHKEICAPETYIQLPTKCDQPTEQFYSSNHVHTDTITRNKIYKTACTCSSNNRINSYNMYYYIDENNVIQSAGQIIPW